MGNTRLLLAWVNLACCRGTAVSRRIHRVTAHFVSCQRSAERGGGAEAPAPSLLSWGLGEKGCGSREQVHGAKRAVKQERGDKEETRGGWRGLGVRMTAVRSRALPAAASSPTLGGARGPPAAKAVNRPAAHTAPEGCRAGRFGLWPQSSLPTVMSEICLSRPSLSAVARPCSGASNADSVRSLRCVCLVGCVRACERKSSWQRVPAAAPAAQTASGPCRGDLCVCSTQKLLA